MAAARIQFLIGGIFRAGFLHPPGDLPQGVFRIIDKTFPEGGNVARGDEKRFLALLGLDENGAARAACGLEDVIQQFERRGIQTPRLADGLRRRRNGRCSRQIAEGRPGG